MESFARNTVRIYVILVACMVLFSVFVLKGTYYLPASADDPRPVELYRAQGMRMPFNFVWGIGGLVEHPYVTIILCALAVLMSLFDISRWWPKRWTILRGIEPGGNSIGKLLTQPHTMCLLVAVATAGLAYLLRVPFALNSAFGDGHFLSQQMAEGWVFAAEVLTCLIFGTASRMLEPWYPDASAGYMGIAIVSILSGVVYSVASWLLVVQLERKTYPRILALLAFVLSGYSVQFYGYVETTCVALAFMACYLASGYHTLLAQRGTLSLMILTIACFSLSAMSHAGAALLAPSLALCWFFSRRRMPAKKIRLYDAWVTVALLLLVILPYFLAIIRPYYLKSHWGNIAGGGDKIMFVPLTLTSQSSPFITYSMFSAGHLLDFLSSVFVASPSAIPLAIISISFLLRARKWDDTEIAETRSLSFLLTAAVLCFSIPLLWNHDFGMWGDWNIATSYIAPLNLFCWSSLFALGKYHYFDRESTLYATIVLPLLLVQCLGYFSMVFSLH